MERLHENLEYKEFTQPEGIVTAAVCRKSGKLAVNGLCDADPRGSMVESEYFATGSVPTEYCDHHVRATICSASGMLANQFCPAGNRVTGVYIVGGSPYTDDAPYLLAQENYCTIHSPASIVPEIPEIPGISEPEEEDGSKKKKEKKTKEPKNIDPTDSKKNNSNSKEE